MFTLQTGFVYLLTFVLVISLILTAMFMKGGWKVAGGIVAIGVGLWWLGQLDVKDLGNDTTAIYNPSKHNPQSNAEKNAKIQRWLDRNK